jgi:hypothetical protein
VGDLVDVESGPVVEPGLGFA